MSTNVTEFIQDLDVGNFKEKFGAVLSEVAIGVMRSETGAAKGKVTAEFEITMLSSEKVNVKSKLEFVKPTSRGEDKIYDVDLPIPKFNQFDPVVHIVEKTYKFEIEADTEKEALEKLRRDPFGWLAHGDPIDEEERDIEEFYFDEND